MKPVKLTADNLNGLYDTMKSCLIAKKQYEVVIRLHDGSLKGRQRALCKIWYKDIGEAQGFTAGYAEAECKLAYGFRIATEDNQELESIIRRMLDYREPHEKLDIIERYSEFFPILRDGAGMTSDQIGRYLSTIQQCYAEQGIVLTSPKEKELLNYPESQRR